MNSLKYIIILVIAILFGYLFHSEKIRNANRADMNNSSDSFIFYDSKFLESTNRFIEALRVKDYRAMDKEDSLMDTYINKNDYFRKRFGEAYNKLHN